MAKKKLIRKVTWIKDRDINGNYGYRNIKTGEFRTTLPNSKEEAKMPTSPKRRIARHLQSAWNQEYRQRAAKASKQLAKKGVYPNQEAYYEKKLKDMLAKNYQIEKEIVINKAIQYVPKISPYIAMPINVVPNIIDIINK